MVATPSLVLGGGKATAVVGSKSQQRIVVADYARLSNSGCFNAYLVIALFYLSARDGVTSRSPWKSLFVECCGVIQMKDIHDLT